MPDLQLVRTPGDRRQYALSGVGTLRLEGIVARAATAQAAGARWRIARRGFWHRHIEATGEAGVKVGEFVPRSLRRGGTLRWDGRDFELRAASKWRERYALMESDREVAVIESKGWGPQPVKVRVEDITAVEPGLLLFACFVVRGLAQDASAAAGAAVPGG